MVESCTYGLSSEEEHVGKFVNGLRQDFEQELRPLLLPRSQMSCVSSLVEIFLFFFLCGRLYTVDVLGAESRLPQYALFFFICEIKAISSTPVSSSLLASLD